MPLPMSRYERNAIEQGRREGILEGWREGWLEGWREGRQETLQEARQNLIELIGKILKSKFNETPNQLAIDELIDVDAGTLQNYILIIAIARTVDELRARLASPA